MKVELVRFEATDRLSLPGLLYEPRRPSNDAVVFLHGNGDSSVFYSSRTNVVGEVLTGAGIAWLPFNNRGAHLIKMLPKRGSRRRRSVAAGMTYELIRDCVPDIDGAIRFLRLRGYRRIHLVGHSTGANKICVYSARKERNSVSSYVLFAGADDSGLYRQQWGGTARFLERLARCREMVRAGRGGELAPKSWAAFPISWRSLLDTINPDGDYNTFPFLEVLSGERLSRKPLFRHYRSIRKPTLALYGSDDEYCFGQVEECVEILERHAPARAKMRFDIVDGANHGFSGMEEELGLRIARWVLESRKSEGRRQK